MALLFADPGGRFYANSTQASQGIYSSAAFTTVTSGLPAGAVESTALTPTSNPMALVPVPANSGPYYAGFRVYFTTIPNNVLLLQFNNSGAPQTSFYVQLNGTVNGRRNNSTNLGTTTFAFAPFTWYYVEFESFISPTVGTISMKVNGNFVLNLTGQNTQGQGDTNIAGVQIGGGFAYLQDFYIADSTTAFNNGFLGDVSMPILNPNRNGNFAQYAPQGASAIWQCVTDTTPDDLITYAFDSTPTDRMSVGYNSAALTGNILGVVHYSRVQKSDAGARTFSQTVTSGGVDVIATAQAPGTSFLYYSQVVQADPATGTSFTNAGVNQIQGGVETVS